MRKIYYSSSAAARPINAYCEPRLHLTSIFTLHVKILTIKLVLIKAKYLGVDKFYYAWILYDQNAKRQSPPTYYSLNGVPN